MSIIESQDPDILYAAQCYHCGDLCEPTAFATDDKIFCCMGCKTVFEILNENDLLNYYSLDSNPGLSRKSKDTEKYLGFLDDEAIEQQLLDFSSDSLKKVTLFIPAIHCSSCIWLLENLYKFHDGIQRCTVNFPRKELTVDFDPATLSLVRLVEILGAIGYEPVISLESEGGPKNRLGERNFYLKLGVAGFAFANIMLLSFPEYLGLTRDFFPNISRFISYALLALSLPVVLFSASDYYLSAIQGLRQRFINIDIPITLGILTLFGRSLFEILTQSGSGYLDSLAGLVFFLLIGRWYQNLTYQGLAFDRDYKSFFPLAVTVIRKGEPAPLLVKDIEPGDRILVRNKELIPCDSRLISAFGNIDYSFVSGESEIQVKHQGDYVFSGGRQIGSSIELEVLKNVSQSNLTSLWNNQAFGKSQVENSQLLVNKISKYFTLIIVGVALGALAFWWQKDPEQAVLVFSAVLIVACPCALALAAPFTLGSTLRVFGRNNFYLKNSSVIEKVNQITGIIFDKTGTITYSGKSEIEFQGQPLTDQEESMVRGITFHSTHPVSQQIRQHLNQRSDAVHLLPIPDFQELEAKGIMGKIHGHGLKLGSFGFVNNSESNGFGDDGLSRVYLSIDGEAKGAFILRNKYRDGLKEVVRKLGKRYKLGLISGDRKGEQAYLSKLFPAGSELLFELSPTDKLDFVKARQQNGERVLFLGDGLNDAGALGESYLGVAINEYAAAFTPSSDAILLGSEFHRIPTFLDFARLSRRVVIASFILSFLYNIAGLGFAVTGNLTPLLAAILMPLSSVTVVLFATACIRILAWKKKLL